MKTLRRWHSRCRLRRHARGSGRDSSITVVQGSRRGSGKELSMITVEYPPRRSGPGAYARCAGDGLRAGRLDRDAGQEAGHR